MSGTIGLGDLIDPAGPAVRLGEAGLSASSVEPKAKLFAAAAASLRKNGADAAARVRAFWVPGRIEVLGKHTDYAGGRTMIVAADRGFCVVAAPRDDSTVRMIDAGRDETRRFEISAGLSPKLGDWSNYPMTVARRLARNFSGPLRGADVGFASDLPPASGMSSSSAMIVATFFVLGGVNALAERDAYRRDIDGLEDLAGYLGTIENGQSFGDLAGDKGVGTFGGSQDHTAILCCRAGWLSQYSYCPVRFERAIGLPDDYTFAVGSSGVVAEKTGRAMEKYNRASLLASVVAEIWRREAHRDDPHLSAAIAGLPDAADRLRDILSRAKHERFSAADLTDRFEHFVAESTEIIPAAGDALAAGDIDDWGRQVDRSQELTETLLKNQVPQTVFLARTARELGAAAASAFGAGFGGSVWAMVKTAQAEPLLAEWSQRYAQAFPAEAREARFFTTQAGPAAFQL